VLGLAIAVVAAGCGPSGTETPGTEQPKAGADLEPGARLRGAAAVGDLAAVQKMLADGVSPEGFLALHWAAAEGHEDVAAALLAKGAEVNVQTWLGRTPLHVAVLPRIIDGVGGTEYQRLGERKGYPALVKLLLAKGAVVDGRDGDGRTPLHWAAAADEPDIATLLIDAGAKVDGRDGEGRTPLHLAVRGNVADVMALLLKKGASADAPDVAGRTPLAWAAYVGHKEPIKPLVDAGADPNRKDQTGTAPLHWAARRGKKDAAAALLAAKADVNIQDARGFTPLHWAAVAGDKDMVELLLAKGADLNAKDKEGLTPLAAIGKLPAEAATPEVKVVADLLKKRGAKE
jgi:ankyrin repeat protein